MIFTFIVFSINVDTMYSREVCQVKNTESESFSVLKNTSVARNVETPVEIQVTQRKLCQCYCQTYSLLLSDILSPIAEK